ncbi:MAG: hypothetical protein ACI4HM_02410 [Ruminococcus sp.]
MVTNEDFERSVNLCNKRTSLLDLLYETNYNINHPPLSDNEFQKEYYTKNKKSSFFVYLFTAVFIPLTISVIYGIFEHISGKEEMNETYLSVMNNMGIDSEETFILLVIFFFSVLLPTVMVIIHKIIRRFRLSIKLEPLMEQNRKEREEYNAEILPALTEIRDELNAQVIDITNELKSFPGIPEENWNIANELWYLFETHQADSYKEAIYLWNDIQFKKQQTELARQAAEYAEESKEYAYNAMISSQEAADNSRRALILDTYNAYQIYRIRNQD